MSWSSICAPEDSATRKRSMTIRCSISFRQRPNPTSMPRSVACSMSPLRASGARSSCLPAVARRPLRSGIDRRGIRPCNLRLAAGTGHPLPAMRQGKSQATWQQSGGRRLQVLDLAMLPSNAAAMPGLRKGSGGQGLRRLPLPGMWTIHRGVSRMRWLVGYQVWRVRTVTGLYELSGMRLHAECPEETKAARERCRGFGLRAAEETETPFAGEAEYQATRALKGPRSVPTHSPEAPENRSATDLERRKFRTAAFGTWRRGGVPRVRPFITFGIDSGTASEVLTC